MVINPWAQAPVAVPTRATATTAPAAKVRVIFPLLEVFSSRAPSYSGTRAEAASAPFGCASPSEFPEPEHRSTVAQLFFAALEDGENLG